MAKGIQKWEGKGAQMTQPRKVRFLLCRARWKRVEMDVVLGQEVENDQYVMVQWGKGTDGLS